MSKFCNLFILFFCTVVAAANESCIFGTEHYTIYNYYRCKCHLEVPELSRDFVQGSCTRTSFWSCNNCNMKRIQENTFKNQTIYVLQLNNNQLITLDNWIKQLAIVEMISLQNNRITTLRNYTFNHKALIEINLSNNNITTIEPEAFRQAIALKTLILSYNSIEYLPKNLFRFNEELHTLNVSNNLLKLIDINIFDNAIDLNVLDLSYNLIRTIKSDGLYYLGNLKYINLNYNELFNFDALSTFDYAPNLSRIALDGNRWNCSYLKNLAKVMRGKGVTLTRGFEFDSSHILGIKCDHLIDIYATTPAITSQLTADNLELINVDKHVDFTVSLLSFIRTIHIELVVLILFACFAILLVSCTILRRHFGIRRNYMKGTDKVQDLDISI